MTLQSTSGFVGIRARETSRTEAPINLRLALAMRGGVSLAVWIGGACAEIDLLRRVSDRPCSDGNDPNRDRIYRELLDLAGYGRVTVDVMAGASAGGLNGALMAASMVFGFDIDELEGIWVDVADIETLARSTEERAALSILSGERFLEELEDRLKELIQGAAPAEVWDANFDLYLAATLARPRARTVEHGAGQTSTEYDSGALFHFRTRRGHGDVDRAAPDKAAARLARAARATASFPGAFEPAKIHSRRPERFGESPAAANDLHGIFSDVALQPPPGEAWRPIEVIDGGVLDNIPVARAIQAIAQSPSSMLVDRHLLFLHPSPGSGAPPTAANYQRTGLIAGLIDSFLELAGQLPRGTTLIATLRSTLRAKMSSESILEDMAVLQEHNERVAYATLLRHSMARAISPDRAAASKLRELARSPRQAVGERAEVVGVRLHQILTDPVATFGRDPFPSGEAAMLTPMLGWPEAARSGVLDALRVPDETTWWLDAGVIIRVAELIIEWARAIEHRGGTGTAHARDIAYRAQGIARAFIDRWEVGWAVLAVKRPPDHDISAWVVETRELLDKAFRRLSAKTVRAVLSDSRDLGGVLDQRLNGLVQGSGARTGATDVINATWDALVAAHAELRLAQPPLRGAGERDPVHQLLSRTELGSDSLRGLDALLFGARVVAPPSQTIAYHRVSGANPTPLTRMFPPTATGELDVSTKLAGNTLGNFGAFLQRHWRANDWMWGRLDAVVNVVDLLVDAERWRTCGRVDDVDDLLGKLRELIVGDADVQWRTWFESELWDYQESADGPTMQQRIRAELVGLGTATAFSDVSATRRALTARLQLEILRTSLPRVEAARSRTTETPAPVPTPEQLKTQLASYAVGTEGIRSKVNSRMRMLRIIVRIHTVAWRAVLASLQDATRESPVPVKLVVLLLRVLLVPVRAVSQLAASAAIAPIPLSVTVLASLGMPLWAGVWPGHRWLYDSAPATSYLALAALGIALDGLRSFHRLVVWLVMSAPLAFFIGPRVGDWPGATRVAAVGGLALLWLIALSTARPVSDRLGSRKRKGRLAAGAALVAVLLAEVGGLVVH